jgi:hypothetical protein
MMKVTQADLAVILGRHYLTAWTTEEGIPRSTYAAARSSYSLQELFTQGLFSRVCSSMFVSFLMSAVSILAGSAFVHSWSFKRSLAEDGGKHIRPGEALFLHRSTQESKPKWITEGLAHRLVKSGAGEKSRD